MYKKPCIHTVALFLLSVILPDAIDQGRLRSDSALPFTGHSPEAIAVPIAIGRRIPIRYELQVLDAACLKTRRFLYRSILYVQFLPEGDSPLHYATASFRENDNESVRGGAPKTVSATP